jgi:hypothetical protein
MMAALKPATQAVAAAAQGAARAVHAATPRLRPAQLLAQFLVLFAGQQRQVAHSNPMLPLLHITPAQPTAAAVMCPQQAPSTSWRTLVQGVQQAEAAASMVCAYSSATALKQLLQQVANAEAAASRITAHDPRAALASLLQQVAAAEAAVNSVCKHDPHAHLHRLLQQVAESGSTGAGTASGPTPGTACVVCNLGNIGKLAVALALRAALMQHMHSSF